MTDVPKTLFEPARAVLTVAITHAEYLVRPPKWPAAAARQVIRSLLQRGLVEKFSAPIEDSAYIWRSEEDGAAKRTALR